MRTLPALFVLTVLALACGGAQAQIKCWTGPDGRRVCGDTPPPGAKTTTIRAPSGPATGSEPAAKDAKDAKKGPMTPAEQEADFRKRQAESQKAAQKAEAERAEAAAKRENCDRARESLTTLESGQRVARTNPQGERYFLDENQVAGEIAKARDQVKQWCS